MALEQEIDRIYIRLARGLIEPEVAACAMEQLICAYLRLPATRVDPGVQAQEIGRAHV